MNCDRVCKERNQITANDLDRVAYDLFEAGNRIMPIFKKNKAAVRDAQNRIHQIAGRIRDFE